MASCRTRPRISTWRSATSPSIRPRFTTFFESVAVLLHRQGGKFLRWDGSLGPDGQPALRGYFHRRQLDRGDGASNRDPGRDAGAGSAGSYPINISVTTGCPTVNQNFTLTVLRGSAAYTAQAPARVLDTRSGLGAPQGRLGAGQTINLTVTGAPPLAPTTAIAVVLNVTVTNNTAGSFLTVFATGTTRPTASNLNWTAGTTIANLVEVPVGAGGAVTIYNAAGLTDVVADLEGISRPPVAAPEDKWR